MEEIITQVLLFLGTIYRIISDLISRVLEETILKAKPGLSEQFGQGITLLVALTTIYIILEFFTAAKKAVRIILIIGWLMLFLALAVVVGMG